MSLKSKVIKFIQVITHPTLVRFSILFSVYTFLLGLVIGVIIATIFGPEGYTMINNYISDLGSIRYTPTPFILDIIAMVTAPFTIPIFFNLTKSILIGTRDKIFTKETSIGKKIYYSIIWISAILGLISLLAGSVGLFGIGLFSEDRTTELNLHFMFSIVVFAGLVFGSLFSGFAILLKKTIVPRILGIYMMIAPFTAALLFLFSQPPLTKQYMEWWMLFSILFWMVPGALLMYKKLMFEKY